MNEPRQPSPDERPVVLTIAGSDSGGGAGIQADLKTIEAGGGFGTSAVTAITAQNTRGVESSHVLPLAEIEAQIGAVAADFDVRAVKTGMLATRDVVELVADRVRAFDCPAVVDPVMVATSGDRLLSEEAEDAYAELVAEATVVTPNADEAAVLTGQTVDDEGSARVAGEEIRALGADAVLVKGGHVDTGDRVFDTLVTADGEESSVRTFSHPRIATDATHGSGCTLSSAIATHLARGAGVPRACERSTAFMERAVRYHLDVGEGPGAVHHLARIRERAGQTATVEAVEGVVAALVRANVRALVPEVGLNVVGATAYAESAGEVAAVEGRITRTVDGIAPNRGVRFGASANVAEFLLAARERAPALRFACNCRFDDDVAAALDALDWPTAEYDRTSDSPVAAAVGDAGATPAAVVDRGAEGIEPTTRLVASDAATLRERALALGEAVETS
jgi:hydroxymethylpyrimidine/phosphomethylpyrimidine kinase